MAPSPSVRPGTRHSTERSPSVSLPSPTLTNASPPAASDNSDDPETPTVPPSVAVPPESPLADSCEPSFEIKCASFADWQRESMPLVSGAAVDLWMHSKFLVRETLASFSSVSAEEVPVDDDLTKGIVSSVDSKINVKGSLKAAQKESLKRDMSSLKIGHIQAMKRLKHSNDSFRRYSCLMEGRQEELMKEIRSLRKENTDLKGEVQSLCTVNNTNKKKFLRKENDLKNQALLQCAMKYSEKQKIGHKLFHQFGFVISKSLLTVHPKSIKKANDFGPNSSKAGAGRPFFKSFFKELSKKHNVPKADDMASVKNHELVYNHTIDSTVANDRNNYLTGHFLDTQENRALIWYGSDTYGCLGVASSIVKFFNNKRSDESSKKIRPVIGMWNSQVFLSLNSLVLILSFFSSL